MVDAGNWTDCENVTRQKKNNLIVDNDITQKEIMAFFFTRLETRSIFRSISFE